MSLIPSKDLIINNNNYIIRDACFNDIENIFELSKLLNTINLPADKTELEQVIIDSENSFSLQEQDVSKRSFLFVLTDPNNRVIGTSQIFAKHGTFESPHHYFQVEIDERYSTTLNKYFRHQTLRLCQSFDGPTEVGSLVLHPDYRLTKEKHGRNLSYVRFLFIAMQPHFFSHHLLAELLPPLGPDFASPFWDALGRKFTELDYYEADMLSRKNREFIKTLFPREVYFSMLPTAVQELIGQVGHHSKGAAHLLSKIGFRYSYRVDPFDGGPHFEATQDELTLIKEAYHGSLAKAPLKHDNFGLCLCARFLPEEKSGKRFKAVASPYAPAGEELIYVPQITKNIFGLGLPDKFSAIYLS